MTERHYAKHTAKAKELRVRVPEALYVHLLNEAELHHRSLSAEVLHLLMDPKRRVYREARQHITQRMRELAQDLYGDGGIERLDAGLPVDGSPPGGWHTGYADDVEHDWFTVPGVLRWP